MNEQTITGGCYCGQVRFTLTAPPVMARTCWCRLCQHIGGGGPTVNAGFPAESLTVQGEVADHTRVADSGSHMHSLFCAACGSHLFSRADERPHLVTVRAGALDDPNAVTPTATIWTTEAPTWACFDADLDQFPGQPPAPPAPAR